MKNRPFRRCPAPKLRSILLVAPLFAMLLAGCVTTPKSAPIIVPESLRRPCERAPIGPLRTEGDKDALVIRQEGAVEKCDGRGNALVEIIDGHNKALEPRRDWWPF